MAADEANHIRPIGHMVQPLSGRVAELSHADSRPTSRKLLQLLVFPAYSCLAISVVIIIIIFYFFISFIDIPIS